MAPPLAPHEVHLWWIEPEGGDAAVAAAGASLSADERSRAARLRSDAERARFVLRRQALRTILAGYVGQPPESLVFVTGALGKPDLAPVAGRVPLRFSLSHRGGAAVLAVTRSAAVGVDLECLRPVPEWQAVARRLFTPAEVQALSRLDEHDRLAGFLRLWTGKEAVVKALGGGLSIDLRSFEVDVQGPSHRAPVCWRQPGSWPALQWLVVPPVPGHVLALVADDDVDRCQLMDGGRFTSARWPRPAPAG